MHLCSTGDSATNGTIAAEDIENLDKDALIAKLRQASVDLHVQHSVLCGSLIA